MIAPDVLWLLFILACVAAALWVACRPGKP